MLAPASASSVVLSIAWRLRSQGNPPCVGTLGGVDLRMTLLPAKLKRNNYSTAIVGKW